jgi:type IV pilus assembly protein PilQ
MPNSKVAVGVALWSVCAVGLFMEGPACLFAQDNQPGDSRVQTPAPPRTKKLNVIKTGRIEKDGVVTQFYQFGSRRGEFLEALLNGFKSEKGIVKTYPELGVLTITDTADKVAELDVILNIVDMPDPQITIEAQVVEVSLDDDFQFGIDTAYQRDEGLDPNRHLDEATIKLNPEEYLQQLLNFQGGTIAFLDSKRSGELSITLRAMAREGKADIKSHPRVTVVNSQEATLITGQDYPYVASSSMVGGAVQSTIGYKEVGIQLKVIPFFIGNDTIELSVSPSVSVVTGQVQIGGSGVPIVAKRGITTKVNVKSGQTLVIGGLLRDEVLTSERKIPILGDIPLLGSAFRSEREQKYKSELLFLITPRLVDVRKAGAEAPALVPREEQRVDEEGK